jgi:hypothetical protein
MLPFGVVYFWSSVLLFVAGLAVWLLLRDHRIDEFDEDEESSCSSSGSDQ